ncbi:hypothetical protein CsatB_013209 [Cannabis sativa]
MNTKGPQNVRLFVYKHMKKVCTSETKLDAKLVGVMQQRATQGTSMKSFDSIILKFPKIDENLRNCKTTFQLFDEDSNGAIDEEEMKKCFHKLGISFTEEDMDGFFKACDFNEDKGIKFNEFIVLLCLVYLLKEDQATLHSTKLKSAMPNLEATFETLVDAFVFLEKNKDGQRSSGRIAMRRFEEMDWDKNGMVNFKEFLFAYTRWVGIDEMDEEEEEEEGGCGS